MVAIARLWVAWMRRSQWVYLEGESEGEVGRVVGALCNVYEYVGCLSFWRASRLMPG